MQPLQAIIIDDESLSRRALRQLLDGYEDVTVIAECSAADEALEVVDRADVIFLDVEMPGVSGVEFARTLEGERKAAVVFVTAHERYAIPAFDIAALDFLTKPVESARLRRALERVQARQRRDGEGQLVAKLGARDLIVPVADVVAVEADGVYAAIHADRRLLIRRSLHDLQHALGATFVRVHRSWLVRRGVVREVRPSRDGWGKELVLANGLVVPVSRRRQGVVEQVTGLAGH